MKEKIINMINRRKMKLDDDTSGMKASYFFM